MKITDHETSIWNELSLDDIPILVSADFSYSHGTPGSLSDAPGYTIENLTAIDPATRQEIKLTSKQEDSIRHELTTSYASQL